MGRETGKDGKRDEYSAEDLRVIEVLSAKERCLDRLLADINAAGPTERPPKTRRHAKRRTKR